MSDYFEVPARPGADTRYAGYGLSGNPFRVDEDLATMAAATDAERFKKIMCALEVERLAALVNDEVYSDMPRKLWLKEEDKVAKRFNNVVTTGLFRSMVSSSSPRLMPVYVPVPQALDDFTTEVYKMIIDRFLPRDFKHTAYAFIYQELKRVSGGDPAAGPFNAVELLNAMDETAGVALDEILFGHEFALTEAEEYGIILEEENEEPMDTEALEKYLDEGGSAEIASEAETTPLAMTERPDDGTTQPEDATEKDVVEEAPVDPRRAAILAFADRRLNEASYAFGDTLKSAVRNGLSDSFVKARLTLQNASFPKEELLGLIRFIGRYYDGVVVFIDQLDPWVIFTEQEKIKFLSSVHEFDLISGGRAVLTSVSNLEVFEAFDPRYLKENDIIPLRLEWLSKNVDDIYKDRDEQLALVSVFIAKAGGNGAAPFTPDGISAIFDAAGGSVSAAIDLCGNMLEAGSGREFPPIDKIFVEERA